MRIPITNTDNDFNPINLVKWVIGACFVIITTGVLYQICAGNKSKNEILLNKVKALKCEKVEKMIVKIDTSQRVNSEENDYYQRQRDSFELIIKSLEAFSREVKDCMYWPHSETVVDNVENRYDELCRNLKKPASHSKTVVLPPKKRKGIKQPPAVEKQYVLTLYKKPGYKSRALKKSLQGSMYEYSGARDDRLLSVRIYSEYNHDLTDYVVYLFVKPGLHRNNVVIDSAEVLDGEYRFKNAVQHFLSSDQKSLDVFLRSRYKPSDIYRDVKNSEATILLNIQ